MRPRPLIIAAAAILALTLACSEGFPPEFPVPEFSLKSPLTKTVADNATIKGKPAIVYWFTSW